MDWVRVCQHLRQCVSNVLLLFNHSDHSLALKNQLADILIYSLGKHHQDYLVQFKHIFTQ